MKQLFSWAAVLLTLGGCVVPPPDRHGYHDRDNGTYRHERHDRYERGPDAGPRPGPGYGPNGRWDSRNCPPDRGC